MPNHGDGGNSRRDECYVFGEDFFDFLVELIWGHSTSIDLLTLDDHLRFN